MRCKRTYLNVRFPLAGGLIKQTTVAADWSLFFCCRVWSAVMYLLSRRGLTCENQSGNPLPIIPWVTCTTVYCYCATKYCEPMMRCCHGVVHVMNHVIMSTDHCPHGWAHVSSVSRQPLEEESQIMQTSGHLHSAAVVCWSQPGAGSSVRFL